MSDQRVVARNGENSPWYFTDPDRADDFCAVCKSWDGAPFSENSRDCVWFPEETFRAVGAAPRFHFPRSQGDYHRHVHNDKILRFFRGTYCAPGSDEVDPQSLLLAERFTELTNLDELVPVAKWGVDRTINTGLLTGDICIVRSKFPGVWHLCLMQDDRRFMHCAWPLGVTEGDITQAEVRERLTAVFRARALPPAPDHDPAPDLS